MDTKKLKEVTPEVLQQNGLAGKKDLVKVLGRGTVSTAIKVSAHKFSATAKEAIEKVGGSITIIE